MVFVFLAFFIFSQGRYVISFSSNIILSLLDGTTNLLCMLSLLFLLLGLGIPEDLKEEANKWYYDNIDLIDYRKNLHFGSIRCFSCLESQTRKRVRCLLELTK